MIETQNRAVLRNRSIPAQGQTSAATLSALAEARFDTGDTTGAHDAIDEGLSLEPRNPELLRLKRRR